VSVATYERSVHVDAPLMDVWDFHSRADGLVELTPDWLHLRIDAIHGPAGEPEPEVLETGSTIHASIRPFGIGPRQSWTSEIVAREEGEAYTMFRDVMHDGPFPHWEHTHRFVAHGEGTQVHDCVEYELPGGQVGRFLGPLGVVGFEPMFRLRHRRTKAILGTG
jgi:ligand-binding SRPBCC domain-containing protein